MVSGYAQIVEKGNGASKDQGMSTQLEGAVTSEALAAALDKGSIVKVCMWSGETHHLNGSTADRMQQASTE